MVALILAATLTGEVWRHRAAPSQIEPVSGAIIEVVSDSGSSRTTTSDSRGRFRLDDLPAGDHHVSIDSNGLHAALDISGDARYLQHIFNEPGCSHVSGQVLDQETNEPIVTARAFPGGPADDLGFYRADLGCRVDWSGYFGTTFVWAEAKGYRTVRGTVRRETLRRPQTFNFQLTRRSRSVPEPGLDP
jgi:hypothetical protein